jgi:hypothetical protein
MMRREGGRVLIDISDDDYNWLMMVLGFATAHATPYGIVRPIGVLRLANAINEGNPNWTPYEIPAGTETALDG